MDSFRAQLLSHFLPKENSAQVTTTLKDFTIFSQLMRMHPVRRNTYVVANGMSYMPDVTKILDCPSCLTSPTCQAFWSDLTALLSFCVKILPNVANALGI